MERVDEFYNRHDALGAFEKKFYEKTANKWMERERFQIKPGKYVLFKKDSEKELIGKCVETEKELLSSIKTSSN